MMPQTMTNFDPVTAYAIDAVNGAIVTGELVKAACRRHLDDLEHGHERDLVWSMEAALRPIRFANSLKLAHGPVAGTRLTLQPWQEFIIGSLYGWLKADGTRRFNQAFLSAGRKNAITTIMSAIGLNVLTDGEERGKQIYHLGATDPQAELSYHHMASMGKASPTISARVKFNRARSADTKTRNTAAPVTNGSRSMDGMNPHTIIADGLQAFRHQRGFDQLTQGMGMWKEPLTLMAGHAHPDQDTFGHREWDYAAAVAKGEVRNDQYFAHIATLDKDDDLMDESVWPKANPNLGVSKPLEYMRQEAMFARRDPERMKWFQHLHLNLWTVRETTNKETTAP